MCVCPNECVCVQFLEVAYCKKFICNTIFCGMETETVQHIICCCEALARQRYNVSGRPTVQPKHKHRLGKGPLPLHTRRRAIEAVLNEILGLHNKPKAAMHSVHKLTGPKKKKKKKTIYLFIKINSLYFKCFTV